MSDLNGYLPELEGLTQTAVATFYEIMCRNDTAPPLPTVRSVAEYLVGQMNYPTNLVRCRTPMSRSHMQVCRGDYPDSWDEVMFANINYEKEVEIKEHKNFTVAHMAVMAGHLHLIQAIPDCHLGDTTTSGSTLCSTCAL